MIPLNTDEQYDLKEIYQNINELNLSGMYICDCYFFLWSFLFSIMNICLLITNKSHKYYF